MPNILFICTANQIRSPMAAAALRHELNQRDVTGWNIASAGTWAEPGGFPASQKAQQFAQEKGWPGVKEHRSQGVRRELFEWADLVFTMERNQKEALQVEFPFAREKIHQLTELRRGPVYDLPDPGLGQAPVAEVGAEIGQIITNATEALLKWARTYKPEQNP